MKTSAVIGAVLLLAASGTASHAAVFRVTSTRDTGDGTLRSAINDANAEPGSTIHIALGASAEIFVESALPSLEAEGTRLDGGGVTIRQADGCMRPSGKRGCDGIDVTGAGVVVRDIRVSGFLFDGIAVRGRDARDVRIENVQSIDNMDDGVGVSNGAGPVTVDHCLLMGNGFRTKGKGLLVFDDSKATLRDSLVIGDRDGVTVTRGSVARLESVLVAGNWDKGVGVSAGSLSGRDVSILASGRDEERAPNGPDSKPAPNQDGLRVGLGGDAEIEHCRIAGNGDTGVVVLDQAKVQLKDCVIEANHGRPTAVAAEAVLERR
ncbi:MAG TPA: right-handed parallel beta-helix repeat-containing protein [Candidatus Binatia bacterium]